MEGFSRLQMRATMLLFRLKRLLQWGHLRETHRLVLGLVQEGKLGQLKLLIIFTAILKQDLNELAPFEFLLMRL